MMEGRIARNRYAAADQRAAGPRGSLWLLLLQWLRRK
jgi:hypothetical protein